MRVSLSLLLAALVALVSGATQDFRGQIQPNTHLTDLYFIGANAKAHLRAIPNEAGTVPGPDRSVWIARDGSFIIKDVQSGAYTLEIVSRTNDFNKYRVDIPDNEEGKPKLGPQIRIHTPGTSLSSTLKSNLLFHPLILHSTQRLDFFIEPAPFNISSMLGMGSPMLLLGVAALFLVFIMPKISASLDPETQREMAENQQRMQRRMAAVQSGDIQSLLFNDDYVKQGQEREKQATAARVRANVGPERRK